MNLCKEEMLASVEPMHSEWRCRRSSIESLEVMRRRVASLASTELRRSTLARAAQALFIRGYQWTER